MGTVKSLLRPQSRQVVKRLPKEPESLSQTQSNSANNSDHNIIERLQTLHVVSTVTKQPVDNPYKVSQSDIHTKGRLAVNEVFVLLQNHRRPTNELAMEYGVDFLDITNLLRYYGNFQIPDNKPANVKLEFHPLHR